jgi:hypothetical protein
VSVACTCRFVQLERGRSENYATEARQTMHELDEAKQLVEKQNMSLKEVRV